MIFIQNNNLKFYIPNDNPSEDYSKFLTHPNNNPSEDYSKFLTYPNNNPSEDYSKLLIIFV